MTKMLITDIKVGKRIRRDMGDIAGLAADMAEIGLLQPVIVSPEGKLLAGGRRLHAAEKLGWKTIDVIVRTKPNAH
jgi:ParB family chromosome partitioning protein